MKQPKLNNLKIDLEGTEKIRAKMAKVKKVKITRLPKELKKLKKKVS